MVNQDGMNERRLFRRGRHTRTALFLQEMYDGK